MDHGLEWNYCSCFEYKDYKQTAIPVYGQDPQNINNSQDCYTKKFTDALGQGVIVIASTGFVNYKSGLAMISNKSGSRQNTIPYISVNTGEQYKFVGENNNGKSMFLFLFIKYVFIIL